MTPEQSNDKQHIVEGLLIEEWLEDIFVFD